MKSYYPILSNDKSFTCNTCHYAKHKKLPFPSSISHASHVFDLLHMDIWGPCSKPSMHGHKYFLTIVDNHSRFTWVHLMHNKAETRPIIMNFITSIETQYDSKVKIIRSDNGPEFMMHGFYASKGIVHQTTCVETPEQNGIAERKHQSCSGAGGYILKLFFHHVVCSVICMSPHYHRDSGRSEQKVHSFN